MGKMVTQMHPWLMVASYGVVFALLGLTVWQFRRFAGRRLGA